HDEKDDCGQAEQEVEQGTWWAPTGAPSALSGRLRYLLDQRRRGLLKAFLVRIVRVVQRDRAACLEEPLGEGHRVVRGRLRQIPRGGGPSHATGLLVLLGGVGYRLDGQRPCVRQLDERCGGRSGGSRGAEEYSAEGRGHVRRVEPDRDPILFQRVRLHRCRGLDRPGRDPGIPLVTVGRTG